MVAAVRKAIKIVLLAMTGCWLVPAQAEFGVAYRIGDLDFTGEYSTYGEPQSEGEAKGLALSWQPLRYLSTSVERLSVKGLERFRHLPCEVCAPEYGTNESIELVGMSYGVAAHFPLSDTFELFGQLSSLRWSSEAESVGLQTDERMIMIGASLLLNEYFQFQFLRRSGQQFEDSYFSGLIVRF